jgi:hypothetical protein
VSEGSRRTRRERRAQRRRGRRRELAGTGGRVAWKLLFSGGLVASLAGAVVSVFAGEYALIILFCILALLLYTALWIGEAR